MESSPDPLDVREYLHPANLIARICRGQIKMFLAGEVPERRWRMVVFPHTGKQSEEEVVESVYQMKMGLRNHLHRWHGRKYYHDPRVRIFQAQSFERPD
jgi:hypothetical protein